MQESSEVLIYCIGEIPATSPYLPKKLLQKTTFLIRAKKL